MSIWIAILLGVVQGLTEFLPISSSGHLVLLEKFFGVNTNLIFLNVILHLGTLFAVVIFYRKKLLYYLRKPFCKEVKLLILGSIPTVVIYFVFKSFIDNSFGGQYLTIGFLITATFLIICNIISNKNNLTKPLDFKTAFVMGVFQGVAIMPGISRSGSTITSGVVMGRDKNQVADFSFLMSIPIILGSLILESVKLSSDSLSIGFLPLMFGFIFSFLFGFVAIKFMLKIVNKAQFYWFSIYLILLSLTLSFSNI